MATQAEVLEAQQDADLMVARRAFAVTQRLWEGATLRVASAGASIGWHDGDLEPEPVALVNRDGEMGDLVGEIVRVTRAMPGGERSVLAYVYSEAALDVDLSLPRRAFLSLALLSTESLACPVEVIV